MALSAVGGIGYAAAAPAKAVKAVVSAFLYLLERTASLTAESHDRVMVMEVMGRDTGFIALHAGLAGTADVILIPEIPYDITKVCEKIRYRDIQAQPRKIISSPTSGITSQNSDWSTRRASTCWGWA